MKSDVLFQNQYFDCPIPNPGLYKSFMNLQCELSDIQTSSTGPDGSVMVTLMTRLRYPFHIRELASLCQIKTDKCTHTLLSHHFINTMRHPNMFQPLEGLLQGVQRRLRWSSGLRGGL
jgi:hypothetical protein